MAILQARSRRHAKLHALPERTDAVPTTLSASDLPGLDLVHRGKVRDVYALDADTLLIVATDRLSAFDVVLPDRSPARANARDLNFWFAQTAGVQPTT